MFKNQLQELAQRSCFNLPSYACIREGPDHAPRFKASVNFNGEIFESPGYCSTLRQAEHAAAEVALNVLSSGGPSRSLTARVLDETGIYKNLLQETAHRAGLDLPTYTTTRSGPGHVPIFTSTVELAGMSFAGEPAKTKKQAEKNAAIAAWSALKRMQNLDFLGIKEGESHEEQDQAVVTRFLSNFKSKDDYSKQARNRDHQFHCNQARKRMIKGHIRDNNHLASLCSPSSDHSSKNQPWKLLNLLLDSDGCLNSQKQNSFVSLLPPPPPRTVSKILPPITSSRERPFPCPLNRSIQIQDKAKSQVEKKEIVPSSLLEEHLKDEEEWLGTKLDVFNGPKPIGKEADVFGAFSTTSSRPITLQSRTWKQITSLLEGSQNPYPIPSTSSKLDYLSPNPDRPMFTTGGYNFKPHGIAPAVQIRSVIPVCSAPPAPVRPQEASSSARSGCISTTDTISNKPSAVNKIIESEESLPSSSSSGTSTTGQLGSEFSNKLQL